MTPARYSLTYGMQNQLHGWIHWNSEVSNYLHSLAVDNGLSGKCCFHVVNIQTALWLYSFQLRCVLLCGSSCLVQLTILTIVCEKLIFWGNFVQAPCESNRHTAVCRSLSQLACTKCQKNLISHTKLSKSYTDNVRRNIIRKEPSLWS